MGGATRITHATNAIGKISRVQKSIRLGERKQMDPGFRRDDQSRSWIPAFAGMTAYGVVGMRDVFS